MELLCSLVRSTDARLRLHRCLHCGAVSETFLHAFVHVLGRQARCCCCIALWLVSYRPLALAPEGSYHRSSQDSIYREREPETADRGSDGDDANETCAAGAGLMSRNSLKTSAVGAS